MLTPVGKHPHLCIVDNMKREELRYMKKTSIYLILLALVVTTVLAACSNKTDESGSASKPDSEATTTAVDKDYTLPLSATGAELTVATSDNFYAPKSFTSGLPVWDAIEKNTGVKINWDVTPSAQYWETMRLRLAAGKDLPDIISIPESNPVGTAGNGLIIPLDDLIAQYAPNIRAYFNEFPTLEKAMKAPDGKIYALSSDVTGAAYGDPYGLIIRKDWLDKLNLDEPKTLDDWYNVLKAFKTQDPNGTGKDDVIPLSVEENIEPLGLFGSALGLNLFYSSGYYPDANGKIEYQWMDERAHQLVIWLNKLFTEGLLDPEFMTSDGDMVTSNITRNLVGVTSSFINNTNRYNAAQKAAGVAAVWQITLPPSGDGNPGFYEKYGPVSGWFGITKDAKDPVLAIKWLDYIYASEEGNRFTNFGIEGTSYEMINGEPQFTDWTANHPEGLSFNEALRSLGAMPTLPWIRATSGPLSKQTPAILKMDPPLEQQAAKVKDYLLDSIQYMSGLPTLEESQESGKILADIWTYKNETLSKYIMGQTPIDWDKFVSSLKSLGVEKVIEIKQAQYDRFHQ